MATLDCTDFMLYWHDLLKTVVLQTNRMFIPSQIRFHILRILMLFPQVLQAWCIFIGTGVENMAAFFWYTGLTRHWRAPLVFCFYTEVLSHYCAQVLQLDYPDTGVYQRLKIEHVIYFRASILRLPFPSEVSRKQIPWDCLAKEEKEVKKLQQKSPFNYSHVLLVQDHSFP